MNFDDKNIAYIHCDDGKGNTGTLISCYLLFCRFADSAESAILYYANKRFRDSTVVNQPSQLRYIYYFEQVLKSKTYIPKRIVVDKIFLESLPKFKNKFKIMTMINDVKTENLLF